MACDDASLIVPFRKMTGNFVRFPVACRCRKSDPDVTMVQSAEDRQRKNASDRVDRPRERGVFAQREMCPGAVVILLVRAQHMAQMPLANYEHMIEALASDGADQSFNVAILP